MGLFDKRKKGDDFDSPVENIDLSAPPVEPEPKVIADMSAPAAEPEPSRTIEADEPADDDDYDAPAYGIDDAIQLMRALPGDNVELVVQVVKRTLESTKVKVKTIIGDAARKQSNIEGRIDVLKKEIAEYEQEIATRKDEIARLEADHAETTRVKDRLELAEKLSEGAKAESDAEAKEAPAAESEAAAAKKDDAPRKPARPSASPPLTGGPRTHSTSGTLPPKSPVTPPDSGRHEATAKSTTIIAKK